MSQQEVQRVITVAGGGEGNRAGYYHASKNGEDMISGGPHHQLLAKTRKRVYREGETPRQPDFLP